MVKRSVKKKREKRKSEDEILLLYKIKNKEEELQQVCYREDLLSHENTVRLAEIKQLTEEQDRIVANVVLEKRMEKKDRMKRSVGGVERKDVLVQLKANLDMKEVCDNEMRELKCTNAVEEEGMRKLEREIEEWVEFRDMGQYVLKARVGEMGRGIEEEKERFRFIKDQLEGQGRKTHEQMRQDTSQQIIALTKHAAQETVEKMSRLERQTIYDNEWLVKELSLHRGEVKRLMNELEVKMERNMDLLMQVKRKHGSVVDEVPSLQQLTTQYAHINAGESYMEKEKGNEDAEKDKDETDGNVRNEDDDGVRDDEVVKEGKDGVKEGDEEVRDGDERVKKGRGKGGRERWPVTGGMLRMRLGIV